MTQPTIELYNCDCLTFMRTMKDKSVDLVLTDPPYGIDYNNDRLNRNSHSSFKDIPQDKGQIDYKSLIEELLRIGKMTVVFGAINFFKDLPYKGIWICWDKRTKLEADGLLGSPFELAWCSKIGGYDKIYRVMHGGVINADGPNSPRLHPTQKPAGLMRLIIDDFSEKYQTIFDPFMGSGTTGVACKLLRRNFIGCEISEKYYQLAKRRIDSTEWGMF